MQLLTKTEINGLKFRNFLKGILNQYIKAVLEEEAKKKWQYCVVEKGEVCTQGPVRGRMINFDYDHDHNKK